MRTLKLTVNERSWEGVVPDSATLLEVLRGGLGLTGAKSNCLEGECGVCTVLLDGRAVCSCILLAAQCEGRTVTTIEGMAAGDAPHPLQRTFIDCGAVQCGFCIPGMVMTAAGFLAENPHPNREQIKEGLCGTLCRCTGYTKIIDAVESASNMEARGGHV